MSIFEPKLLRVEAPHFVAGAVWEFNHGWQCVEDAPIIHWMVGKEPRQVKRYLERKGWKYTWS